MTRLQSVVYLTALLAVLVGAQLARLRRLREARGEAATASERRRLGLFILVWALALVAIAAAWVAWKGL